MGSKFSFWLLCTNSNSSQTIGVWIDEFILVLLYADACYTFLYQKSGWCVSLLGYTPLQTCTISMVWVLLYFAIWMNKYFARALLLTRLSWWLPLLLDLGRRIHSCLTFWETFFVWSWDVLIWSLHSFGIVWYRLCEDLQGTFLMYREHQILADNFDTWINIPLVLHWIEGNLG